MKEERRSKDLLVSQGDGAKGTQAREGSVHFEMNSLESGYWLEVFTV